jgi:phenol hydroxylase P5 protein
MPVQTFRAKTAEHILIKGKFQFITFELIDPATLNFKARQLVLMNLPGIPVKRNYSIASNPADNHKIDILVDVGPQGDGSLYLQSLNPGEEVSFMAPAGRFVLADDPKEKKLIFIATGSGISAVKSMILNLLQTQNDSRRIHLNWGLRYVQDIFWEDEFRLLEKQFPNFYFDLVISKAPEGWPLCTGHITDCLNKHYKDYQNTGYYLCGNKHMIEDTLTLLKSKGVNEANIHHERFF